MKVIFWFSLTILVYIYFGYPLLLWIGSKMFDNPIKKKQITLFVTFIVVVHNEEEYIEEKIKNILELEYPKENLEIIIGSDGSTDNTEKILGKYTESQDHKLIPISLRSSGQAMSHVDKKQGVELKVIISKERKGKVNLLREIVPQAKGEIIVFSDVRQKFKKDALKEIIANFVDYSVGCVSGELVLEDKKNNQVSRGVGVYWRYEKWMRKTESKIHSMIGATGAIYAVRKQLIVLPPPNTILDDVFIPLKVVEQGYRAIFDSKAQAHDKPAYTSAEEFRRKVRTLAGNFQLFVLCKDMLVPFKSKIFWQFFSHKFLRAVAFFFLITLFVSNMVLRNYGTIYTIFFILQVGFYGIGVIGLILEKLHIRGKITSVPYMFCVLNFAALKGFLRFLFRRQSVKWEKARHYGS